jgi:hypothetical protein
MLTARLAFVASVVSVVTVVVPVPAGAQWFNHPAAGIPRTADGKPHLAAPAPRGTDGKPDLSGLWQPADILIGDLAKNLKPGSVPYQPWAEALYKERRANEGRDDPTANCIVGGVPRSDAVPYPFKILHRPGLTVILYEAVHSYRQIFSDGRALPKDMNPSWFGYSVARWEGDTYIVETSGFNDKGWLDNFGKPATDALHVIERFRRKDFGHMDIEITIDDPKAYTKPWTVNLPLILRPDTDLLEYICNENNKYFNIIPK